jgi:hypothetical protein
MAAEGVAGVQVRVRAGFLYFPPLASDDMYEFAPRVSRNLILRHSLQGLSGTYRQARQATAMSV